MFGSVEPVIWPIVHIDPSKELSLKSSASRTPPAGGVEPVWVVALAVLLYGEGPPPCGGQEMLDILVRNALEQAPVHAA